MTKADAIQKLEQAGHVLDAPKAGWFGRLFRKGKDTPQKQSVEAGDRVVPLPPFKENAVCPRCDCEEVKSWRAGRRAENKCYLYLRGDGEEVIYYEDDNAKRANKAGNPKQITYRECALCKCCWIEAMPIKEQETHE